MHRFDARRRRRARSALPREASPRGARRAAARRASHATALGIAGKTRRHRECEARLAMARRERRVGAR
jgi:hypothetical protein